MLRLSRLLRWRFRNATYCVVLRPAAGYCIVPAEHRSRSWEPGFARRTIALRHRPIPPVRSDSPASAVLVIPMLGIRMSRHANRSSVRRLAPADSSRLLCSSEMVDVGWCFATFAIAARC